MTGYDDIIENQWIGLGREHNEKYYKQSLERKLRSVNVIKTVKAKKEFNFRELMEHIFSKSEEVCGQEFKSRNGDHSIKINAAGRIFFSHREPKGTDAFNHGEIYEIDVEEEITEDTKFENLVEVTRGGMVYLYKFTSINVVLDEGSKVFYTPLDGELVKIWECE